MNIQEKKNTESAHKDLRYKQLQDFSTEVDWRKLVDSIVHQYVESGIGRLQVPIESMIRVYFLQLRYNLSASEASLALSKIDVLRDFALIEQGTDVLPEEGSIDMFRSLIELQDLTEQFAAEFNIQPMNTVSNDSPVML